MSPRRHRRAPAPPPRDPRAGIGGSQSIEDGPDGRWFVRRVPGDSGKTYRCPGCDQEIVPGVAHVVAWPEEGLDERRHWHTPCWRARRQRGPRWPRR